MRLRFWRWVHDRAERLWHWTFYYKLPEGIEQRLAQQLTARNVQVKYVYPFPQVIPQSKTKAAEQ